MAEALVETLEDVDAVVAYNKSFEKRCLELISAGAASHAPRLKAIGSMLHDLLPVVRDHVYHPDFLGSFSLKSVLPALVPDLGYEPLEISQGQIASALLHRLLFLQEPTDPAELAALRQSLLDYCALDTLALVRLRETLDDLAHARD
jgi:hypothetical protein